jgi:hypothetical protein
LGADAGTEGFFQLSIAGGLGMIFVGFLFLFHIIQAAGAAPSVGHRYKGPNRPE